MADLGRARYSQILPATARYSQVQPDTARYNQVQPGLKDPYVQYFRKSGASKISNMILRGPSDHWGSLGEH